MRLWQLLLLLLSITARIKGYTHWVVRENGKIQTKLDTPFRLSRQHDLISLLDQEHRHREITILFEDLIERRKVIDLKTSSLVNPSEVETRVFVQNPECQLSTALRLDSIDFYSYVGVANGSSVEGLTVDLLNEDERDGFEKLVDCREFSTLNFSMFAYEHMPVMIKRREFKVAAMKDKEELKNIMPVSTLGQFNEEIIAGLQKNSSSWLHYNWGTLYWWMNGDGHMALECARRALYYVPRSYKHIPLLNLGSLLHQGHAGAESAILLHAALDHVDTDRILQLDRDDACPSIALALAHVYAARADFNTSATYLDGYLRARPDDEDARLIKLAITCHRRVEEHLISLLLSLQDLLTDLHTYHVKQQAWFRLHERSSWEQAPGPDLLASLTSAANLASQIQTKQFFLSDAQLMNAATQRKKDDDDDAGISCEAVERGRDTTKYGNEEYLNQLVKLAEEQMDEIERTLSMSGSHMGGAYAAAVIKDGKANGNDIDITVENNVVVEEAPYIDSETAEKSKKSSNAKMPEQLNEKYPMSGAVSVVEGNMYFDSTDWPGSEDCDSWNLPLDGLDDLDLPIFMPPENKGFQVVSMLSAYIDLPLETEHPLPWHPPHCEYTFKDDVTAKLLAAHDQRTKVQQAQPHAKILEFLRNYSGIDEDMEQEGDNGYAEIGQRIVSALKRKSGPSYVLKTIASLYWRAKNNAMNALSCLNSDLSEVPNEHQDMLFVSIGSLLHHLGYIDKALQYAKAAFKINFAEPSTNFLLALLHYQRNNPILAKHYMRNVLRADKAYYGGLAERLLRIWACRIKTGRYKDRQPREEKQQAQAHVADKIVKMTHGQKVDEIERMIREREKRVEELKRVTASSPAAEESAATCERATRRDQSGKYPDLHECVRRERINAIKRNGKLPEARCALGKEFCGKDPKSIDRSAIATLLLNMDDSVDNEPPEEDQSQLESLIEPANNHRDSQYFIKIPKDFFSAESKNLGDFYITASLSDDGTEEIFHIFDKSGSYPLSHKACKVIQGTDWLQFTSMWQSTSEREFNVAKFLKPLHKHAASFKPFCSKDLPKSQLTLDHLTSMVLRHRLPNDVPESYLNEWLALITGDKDATIADIGTKISLALQENGTSWILATAAALYWRVFGNTEAAVNCLRQALIYVPAHVKDIPLINLANVLNRIGFHADALEVTYLALDSHPNVVLNHFTAGNIYDSIGDIDNAILFYRGSLNIDANFEPARNRLQAILCTLLFDNTE